MDEDEDIHPEAAVAPGYLANHAARVFNRVVDERLRPHGLTLALLGPIMLLSWKGPMRQRDLVAASAVKQPAMVALLTKLEAMNLIERAPVPDDGRAAIVRLTPRGTEAATIGRRTLLEANAQGVSDLDPDEARMLTRLLQRVIARLEAVGT